MAEGTVASLRGDWAAVVRAVNAVFGGAKFILLAEDVDAMVLPHFLRVGALDESHRHPRGRAFDPRREVRWREVAPGRFALVCLSEDRAGLPVEAGLTVSGVVWETHATSQKLYGKWSESAADWVEVAVPGVTGKYARVVDQNPPPGSLKLEAVDYIRDGMAQMTRFCAVAAYEL